jgi:hypothetical protein
MLQKVGTAVNSQCCMTTILWKLLKFTNALPIVCFYSNFLILFSVESDSFLLTEFVILEPSVLYYKQKNINLCCDSTKKPYVGHIDSNVLYFLENIGFHSWYSVENSPIQSISWLKWRILIDHFASADRPNAWSVYPAWHATEVFVVGLWYRDLWWVPRLTRLPHSRCSGN